MINRGWQSVLTAQGRGCLDESPTGICFLELAEAQIRYPKTKSSVVVAADSFDDATRKLAHSKVISAPFTDGALCTSLFAFDDLDMEAPLVVSPGDFYIDFDLRTVLSELLSDELSSAFSITIDSQDPRLSYVRVDEQNNVLEYCEKQVVSKEATTGIFGFRKASEYLDAADWVLTNKINHEQKFYVSSAMNYFIMSGKRVANYNLGLNSDCFVKNWAANEN